MILFLAYVFFAATFYVYFYKNTKDALNPFGVSLGFFLFATGASCLKLNQMQFDLSIKTHFFIILVSSEIFMVGCYFTRSLRSNEHNNISDFFVTNNYHYFKNIIVVGIFLTCLYIWVKNGRYVYKYNSELFDMKTVSRDIMDLNNLSSYFISLLPYTVIYVFYELLFDRYISKRRIIFDMAYSAVIICFVWFVLVSRGILLVIFLGILYLLNVKYKFKVKYVVIAFSLLLAGMAILMTLRLNIQSVAFSGKSNNVYFNTIYNYIGMNFQVFDKLVQKGSPYSIIGYSWITLSKMFGIHHPEKNLYLTVGVHNATTFMYPFYHDLGLLGLILYPTLIYTIIGLLYKQACTTKPYLHLYLAILQKPIMVIFYGNYFFGAFSSDVQYFVTIGLIFFSFRVKQISTPRVRFVSKKNK